MAKRVRRRVAGRGKQKVGTYASPEASPQEGGGILEWVKSLLVAAVIFLVLRTFLIQTFVITSGSMEPTLLEGDFLVVNRSAIGSRIPLTSLRIPGYSAPRRFDVIVFDPPHEPDLKLVKRLIGMPGDTLQMRARTLYINGKAIDEPYLQHVDIGNETHPWMSWQTRYLAPGTEPAEYRPTRDDWGPLVVPSEHYFMLGDNREESLDSRYWGLLESWRLEGRAVFIYFSYNRGSFRPLPFLTEIRGRRIGDPIR